MTPEERERYSRQIRFAGLGLAGQEKLANSRVAIAGCGALGTFQAGALARAGVQSITIIDRDYVELGNLHRQWLFDEDDAAQALPKAIAAANHLRRISSECRIAPAVADLTAVNVDELLGQTDLILDGTDNFETRFLINDFAVRENIPWIYGAAIGSYGIAMPVIPGRTCCLRCVYPQAPQGVQPTCETAGILNTITSLVASWQVALATKLLGAGSADVEPAIFTADVWSGKLRQVEQPGRDPACPTCGLRNFSFLDERRRTPVSLCGRNAVQIHERQRPIDLKELGDQLGKIGAIRANDFALRFFPEPYEMTIFADGRAIIKGTTDIGIARGLYARYIGA